MQVSYPAFPSTNKMETRPGFFFRGRGRGGGVLAHLKIDPEKVLSGLRYFELSTGLFI